MIRNRGAFRGQKPHCKTFPLPKQEKNTKERATAHKILEPQSIGLGFFYLWCAYGQGGFNRFPLVPCLYLCLHASSCPFVRSLAVKIAKPCPCTPSRSPVSFPAVRFPHVCMPRHAHLPSGERLSFDWFRLSEALRIINFHSLALWHAGS